MPWPPRPPFFLPLTSPLPRAPSQSRKAELQRQALAALEADNAWWRAGADAPPNLVAATSPAEYKRLIMGAAPGQLVVVDYLKPSCAACRRLMPKVHQIAASNPDILVIKVGAGRLAEGARAGRLSAGCWVVAACRLPSVSCRQGLPPAPLPLFPLAPLAHPTSHSRLPLPPPPPQVNVDESPEMQDLGRGMGVAHLPW